MALLILVFCTVHKPPTYIPKKQCLPYKQLMGQWGQVLKSWIRKGSRNILNWRVTWQQRQVLQCNCVIACKHSTHHAHMQPQVVLVLQVLVLMAMAAHNQDQVYFDTNSPPISINNQYSACISYNTNFIDTPRPFLDQSKDLGGLRSKIAKWAQSDGNGRMTRA